MSDLYPAVDLWGRELKEGDTVISQGRIAQFSHCTAKRIMVRIPNFTRDGGFQLIQRQSWDVQKFVPELETEFLERMAEAKLSNAEWKKEKERERKAYQAEMEKLRNERSN